MTDQLSRNENATVDISQFKFLKVLGEGAFGKVLLVRKVVGQGNDSLYAMKVQRKTDLNEPQRRRIKLERDILMDIAHPFIIELTYAFQTAGKLFLILNFCKGGTLLTLLSKKVKFTEYETRFYLAELALALGHLHAKGIVHNDVKPENVLLDSAGHLILTDFGLAEMLSKDLQTFSSCGTIVYMAPEVLRKKGHSFQVDWWAFGISMLQMLTGRLPFDLNNQKKIILQILKRKFEMPPDLSLGAKSLLRALLQKDPTKRIGAAPGGVTVR